MLLNLIPEVFCQCWRSNKESFVGIVVNETAFNIYIYIVVYNVCHS